MNSGRLRAFLSGSLPWIGRFLWVLPAVALLLVQGSVTESASPALQETVPTRAIPIAEFSRLVQQFSEEEGYFTSDNFISNETSYLHVVDKLRQLEVSGGAYLGVGPEQNFTYIAKVRPQIAFIVDIRRQAVIQHLLYKAIFHAAKNRAEFLSLLLSRPLPRAPAQAGNGSLDQWVEHFHQVRPDPKVFAKNLAHVRKTIEEDFRIPLSETDLELLQHVYSAFARGGLNISFRFGRGSYGWGWGSFPTLTEILLAEDLNGQRGNFLAREEDYQFLRQLHRKNRIIPVVGDFAGDKALAAVASYLRKNHYTVSAFYTSNVEQYLFGGEVFDPFVKNVQRLPITHKSVFIRAVRAGWAPHPAQMPGHRMFTLLQNIPVFLEDYDQGRYSSYRELVTTHFIGPQEP
ncbi:MAG: hypothetical protein HY647_08000 [Acidobacteria bacterium]|nr:hypothetical protein [Acidobacteriota bacterium]